MDSEFDFKFLGADGMEVSGRASIRTLFVIQGKLDTLHVVATGEDFQINKPIR